MRILELLEGASKFVFDGAAKDLMPIVEGEVVSVAAADNKVFELGGMAISKKLSALIDGVVYGATSAASVFNITNPGLVAENVWQLTHGQGFSITVSDGATFNFTASKAANEVHLGYFHSLTTLRDAIEITTHDKVRATISGGKLELAARDANDFLHFEGIRTLVGAAHVFEIDG